MKPTLSILWALNICANTLVKAVSQAVQIGWKYTHVAVAIDPMTGRLWWAWQDNMTGEEMARIWGAWAAEPDIDGWVWDGGHTGEDMQAVDAPQVVQPPYAPEPDPVERFFRELRRARNGCIRPCRPSRRPWSPSCEPGRPTRTGCGNCAAGPEFGTPWRPCPPTLKSHSHTGLVLYRGS